MQKLNISLHNLIYTLLEISSAEIGIYFADFKGNTTFLETLLLGYVCRFADVHQGCISGISKGIFEKCLLNHRRIANKRWNNSRTANADIGHLGQSIS